MGKKRRGGKKCDFRTLSFRHHSFTQFRCLFRPLKSKNDYSYFLLHLDRKKNTLGLPDSLQFKKRFYCRPMATLTGSAPKRGTQKVNTRYFCVRIDGAAGNILGKRPADGANEKKLQKGTHRKLAKRKWIMKSLKNFHRLTECQNR